MKKKWIILAAAAVVILGGAAGGTMAAYQAQTSTDKTISTSSVDVKLNIEGVKVDEAGNVLLTSNDLQDGVAKERVSAVNAGNKSVYVRVRITKAWYSRSEKVFEVNGRSVDSSAIEPDLTNQQDWIVPAGPTDPNHENIYIYYRYPLAAGATTSAFMDSFSLLKNTGGNTNHYAGLSAGIRFDADSIQTTAAKDAMLAEWGVHVTFDENGRIDTVVNQ